MCCGRRHAGEHANSAEALMRSRYVAFAMKNEPYLLATWHLSQRPTSITFEDQLKWLGLKVVSARDIGTDKSEVEFIARYRVGGQTAQRMHERSRFVYEDGRWFYVDGDQLS